MQSSPSQPCILSPAGQLEVKAHLLAAVCDATSPDIRAAASTTISAASGQSDALPLSLWPELLPYLVSLIESPGASSSSQHGSFLTLVKLSQDAPAKLDCEELGRPMNHLVPLFLKYAVADNAEIRAMSLEALCSFVADNPDDVPTAVRTNLDGFLAVLGRLASDPEPKVKRLVCSALYYLFDGLAADLTAQLPSICEFMLSSVSSPDAECVMTSLDFFTLLSTVEWDADGSSPQSDVNASVVMSLNLVPRLLPLLVNHTVYSAEERIDLKEENRKAELQAARGGAQAGSAGNQQPTFYKTRHKQGGGGGGGGGGGDSDDSDSDSDGEGGEPDYEWTKRRAASAAIDALASLCGQDQGPLTSAFVAAFLPLMQSGLSSPDDWHKEAAIHCFGICGLEGIGQNIEGNLTALYPYLMSVLTQPCLPQLKSTACWTLSRYRSWIVNQESSPGGDPSTSSSQQQQPLLFGHIANLLGASQTCYPRVQEAAIISFNRIVEKSGDKIVPILTPIYQNLAISLAAFDNRSLGAVYDGLATLADFVGPKIGDANIPSLFVPTLMSKWSGLHAECGALMQARLSGSPAASDQRTEDAIRNKMYRLLPLLDSIACNCKVLKNNFQPWAVESFDRALETINQHIMYVATTRAHSDRFDASDADAIVCSLDIIDGMVEGFEGNFANLIAASKHGSQLFSVLSSCLKDPDYAAVVMSSFAIVGDMALYCPSVIVPIHSELIAICAKTIPENRTCAVVSNCIWACANLCANATPDVVEPHRVPLLRAIIGRLEKFGQSEESETFMENLSYCLGAVAKVDGRGFRVHEAIGDKVHLWMEGIARINDPQEKCTAMEGACLAIKNFPDLVMGASHRKRSIGAFLIAVISFHVERDYDRGAAYFRITGHNRSGFNKDVNFEQSFSQIIDEYSHDLQIFGDNVAALLEQIRAAIPGGAAEWQEIVNSLPVYIRGPFKASYGALTGCV